MEKNNIEICRDRLTELGIAMFAFYTGKELHQEQLNLIAISSSDEKILAMEIVASTNLKGKCYTNFCQNKKRTKKLNNLNIIK